MKKFTLISILVLLMVAFVVPTASAAPPSAEGYWYTVKYGDTLSGIAYYHGVKLSHLMKANKIHNPHHIYKGQHLWIPKMKPKKQKGHYHKVYYGQTLSSIAYQHGISVWALAKANKIRNIHHIYVGQKIYIPAKH